MSVLALTNAKVVVAQADLSGHSNQVELKTEVEALDSTVFSPAGYRTMVGGLFSVSCSVEGFWSAGDGTQPDDRLFADLGVAGVPLTVSPTGAAVGDVSYFTRVVRPSYSAGAEVGQLMAFKSSANGDGTRLVRGQVADNQARTATGTTAVRTLTVPSASQRVYAAIHVLSASGTTPSLTATLQTDDGVGFASPATVVTGSALTAAGSQWLSGGLAVGEGFYRLSYVISGTSPSFVVVASIGVG